MGLNYIEICKEVNSFIDVLNLRSIELFNVPIDVRIVVNGRDCIDYKFIDTALAGIDLDEDSIYLNLPVIDRELKSIEEFRYLLIHEVSHYINYVINGVKLKTLENNYGHDDNFNKIEDTLCEKISMPVKKINYDILGFSKVRKYCNSKIKVYKDVNELKKDYPNFKPGKHIIYDF